MIARLVLTTGEPAGIGPDLCLAIAQHSLPCALAVAGDADLLQRRAALLGQSVRIVTTSPADLQPHQAGFLPVWPVAEAADKGCGRLNPANAGYILDSLTAATRACLDGRFDALITPPVNKGIINDAGIAFTGHTEFLAQLTGGDPVMLLMTKALRVALATTHLPLSAVSQAITYESLTRTLRVLHRDLVNRFGLNQPRILVAGLNPHAGESGHLGREEIEVIEPVLQQLRTEGLNLVGPLPADTLFLPSQLAQADAVLAMYHDQGLPVLKHVGFGRAVNITLGLPIIRTSVDHGTALDLAGTGRADAGSLLAALEAAIEMVHRSHTRQPPVQRPIAP
ncbi:MAG: 4-hydroxythreonine-4-phosphate dehydrogenase PdxA [Methylococcaceae bacterium]|jgi:4-hydroxythreonine-4-phosphate dehydrogenase